MDIRERFKRAIERNEFARELMKADGSTLSRRQAVALSQATLGYNPSDEREWAELFEEVGLKPELAGVFTGMYNHRSHAA